MNIHLWQFRIRSSCPGWNGGYGCLAASQDKNFRDIWNRRQSPYLRIKEIRNRRSRQHFVLFLWSGKRETECRHRSWRKGDLLQLWQHRESYGGPAGYSKRADLFVSLRQRGRRLLLRLRDEEAIVDNDSFIVIADDCILVHLRRLRQHRKHLGRESRAYVLYLPYVYSDITGNIEKLITSGTSVAGTIDPEYDNLSSSLWYSRLQSVRIL